MRQNRLKNGKKTEIVDTRTTLHLEYVGLDVLSMLLGVNKNEITLKRVPEIEKQVRSRCFGRCRKFHFVDAARLVYPDLSPIDYALLRIDINDRLWKRKVMKNAVLGE